MSLDTQRTTARNLEQVQAPVGDGEGNRSASRKLILAMIKCGWIALKRVYRVVMDQRRGAVETGCRSCSFEASEASLFAPEESVGGWWQLPPTDV